jgi:hypothetical protein
MPVKAGGVVTFRLNGKSYAADQCTCLFRAADMEEMVTRLLVLTRDGRFAYLGRVIGGKVMQAAEDWSADRAMRFLIQHGEGDLVDEFPDIFRKRAPSQPTRGRDRRVAASPRGRPAEPYLFPLS